ncbi:MAG: hypothetical protein IJX99_09060 [Clostridia bacterium]|nr:hypothetical protein [Clostridia bacterium]
MAKRPAFTVINGVVVARDVEFEWFPGFSAAQKRRSIEAMHREIPGATLEVSTKSKEQLGVKLSAFTLKLGGKSLESIFQGSKVFKQGGPYIDMYDKSPRDAKHDLRLKTSGELEAFEYNGVRWELLPRTAFYDYIYVKAVKECLTRDELQKVAEYQFFTDIEFNPQKSINTQARAIAIVKCLMETYDEIPEFNQSAWLAWHARHVRG